MDSQLIQRTVDLSAKNTLAVSSEAEYFALCTSLDDIQFCLNWAAENKQSVQVLGGGSNILLPPKVHGLSLHISLKGIELIEETPDAARVKVAAGENWHHFVMWSVENQFFGLENLALIPGTVGAAPIQNIGAYGVEVEHCIEAVEVIDARSGALKVLNKKDCRFHYRDSVFKHSEARHLIVNAVIFTLSKTENVNLSYPALRDFFVEKQQVKPSSVDVANAVIAIRSQKLPQPHDIPNVGSFFKNPIISAVEFGALLKRFPDMPYFDMGSQAKKIPAAWLIDQAGWKAQSIDGIRVHAQQALVLINPERKSLTEVLAFASAVQRDIQQRFGLSLEIEPQQLSAIL